MTSSLHFPILGGNGTKKILPSRFRDLVTRAIVRLAVDLDTTHSDTLDLPIMVKSRSMRGILVTDNLPQLQNLIKVRAARCPRNLAHLSVTPSHTRRSS